VAVSVPASVVEVVAASPAQALASEVVVAAAVAAVEAEVAAQLHHPRALRSWSSSTNHRESRV
jgi:hypothetical protein